MTMGPAPMIRMEEMSVRLGMTPPCGFDTFGSQLEMPVALQRAFGEADRLANETFTQAFADRVAEGIEVDRFAGESAEALISRLDVRLADHVAEGNGQQRHSRLIHFNIHHRLHRLHRVL